MPRIALDGLDDSVKCLIRFPEDSPEGFRAGEWARITGVERMMGRPCYTVEFLDGVEDQWPITDPAARYEFQ